MHATSLNISRASDPERHEALLSVVRTARNMGVPVLIIGAWARDLGLRHPEVPPARQTMDTDVAIHVLDWQHYQVFRDQLQTQERFTPCADRHHEERFTSPDEMPVDVLPFGGVEDQDGRICWPTDHVTMSMQGFRDAWKAARSITLEGCDYPDIRVVTLAGVVMLKLVAWSDRYESGETQMRRKHVTDIMTIIRHYVYPLWPDRLTMDAGLNGSLAIADDLQQSARLIGRDIAKIASSSTRREIKRILYEHGCRQGKRDLAADMRREVAGRFDRATAIAYAMHDGINDIPSPIDCP